MPQSSILRVDNLNYSIGQIEVFKNLNLSFQSGTIHGLLGQNGAGKTTLLNILAGALRPTSGNILWDEKKLRLRSPHDAISIGIRMARQEETFLAELTVAENMLLGQYGCGNMRLLNLRKKTQQMQALLDDLKIPLRAEDHVSTLNYGQRQMLKIACLLAGEPSAKILLMDEPYRVCSPHDIEHFYDILRFLRDQGLTIIFSTHQIESALRVCDQLTLLCGDGHCDQLPAQNISFADTVSRISCRPFHGILYPRLSASRSEVQLLKMENVSTMRIDNVSLTLKKGEILGIAGLLGSGRTGIARALCGLDPLLHGRICLSCESLTNSNAAGNNRIGALLCNRKDLLLASMDMSSNITVSNLEMVSSNMVLDTIAERKVGFDYCRQFNIGVHHIDDPARTLSAGNQQKLLLARLFFSNCRILVLDEPTMNIDIISRNDLYNLMNSYICRGNSIILISSDLEELKGMTHRTIVMKDRSVLQEIRSENLTYESLLHLSGHT